MKTERRMKTIMKRKSRGVWAGTFPFGEADPAAVEKEIRAHLSQLECLFADWQIEHVFDHLRVLVEIRKHVPGRGFGTDSAVIGNLEYVVSALIREAQPAPPPPRRSVYEWIREPAL